MKKLFNILCRKNLLTNTKGINKRTKLFNLLINVMIFYGTFIVNLMTCGTYGLIMILIRRRKNRRA